MALLNVILIRVSLMSPFICKNWKVKLPGLFCAANWVCWLKLLKRTGTQQWCEHTESRDNKVYRCQHDCSEALHEQLWMVVHNCVPHLIICTKSMHLHWLALTYSDLQWLSNIWRSSFRMYQMMLCIAETRNDCCSVFKRPCTCLIVCYKVPVLDCDSGTSAL